MANMLYMKIKPAMLIQLKDTIPGEPEKNSAFENSWHQDHFTDLNDSNSVESKKTEVFL